MTENFSCFYGRASRSTKFKLGGDTAYTNAMNMYQDSAVVPGQHQNTDGNQCKRAVWHESTQIFS